MKQANVGICPLCGSKTKHLSTDLRPVFPEERLLLEAMLGKEVGEFSDKSVWAANSRYYIDGASVPVSTGAFREADTDRISEIINQHKDSVSYEMFDRYKDRFVLANKDRLYGLKEEAFDFIRDTVAKYDEERIVVSFSGGKDSTVTADLVAKALSNPSLVHIFGNTTLEFPSTVGYAESYYSQPFRARNWLVELARKRRFLALN